jgi:membrane associated rhomboid family serine protease
MLDLVFLVALWIVIGISLCFFPIPIGNENSTVRRLPYVTFAILALNVLIFFATLPSVAQQLKEWAGARQDISEFLVKHAELMADEGVRGKLVEGGLMTKRESDAIDRQLLRDTAMESEYAVWLKGPEATRLRDELEKKLTDYKAVASASLWYQYGLAPNGDWKFYQLITGAFIHGSTSHLFGNMIFFFAIAFSLEDLWGRSLFLGFYLLGAVAAFLPTVIYPISAPCIGASGAISATMGAFLFRLHKTKIRVRWLSLPLALPLMAMSKKPWGAVMIPAYIYGPFFFGSQLLYWWFNNRYQQASQVGYSAHIAGFVFGFGFAALMKMTGFEEKYIHPKIEAKVSFSASPAVNQALESLDRGEIETAEKKLKAHLAKDPNNPDAIMALIQVYQRTVNYAQLNVLYGRLIRHHLSNNDKEAALYAYDGLLSCFPDIAVDVHIPIRDWLLICEYLREHEMNREAAVEYERLALAYPDDPLALRAYMQGGEAALEAHDNERALRLFEKAHDRAPSPMLSRIEAGIDKCNLRINNRPVWVKEPPKAAESSKDVDSKNLTW